MNVTRVSFYHYYQKHCQNAKNENNKKMAANKGRKNTQDVYERININKTHLHIKIYLYDKEKGKKNCGIKQKNFFFK